jgi:antitoxin Phd
VAVNINKKNMVSITEATENFSRVAHMVDQSGMAVIFKNNVPRYVVTEFSEYEQEQTAEDEDVMRIAVRLIDKHRRAFEEL